METFLAFLLGAIFGFISIVMSSGSVRNNEDTVPAGIIGLLVGIISLVAIPLLGGPWWAITFGPAVLVYLVIQIIDFIGK